MASVPIPRYRVMRGVGYLISICGILCEWEGGTLTSDPWYKGNGPLIPWIDLRHPMLRSEGLVHLGIDRGKHSLADPSYSNTQLASFIASRIIDFPRLSRVTGSHQKIACTRLVIIAKIPYR